MDDQIIAEPYRMADLVLLPSESEGLGLPVLEAGLSRARRSCAPTLVIEATRGAG